ncbi:zinc finger, CCHC-type containing protein [Tanacetum coccineum]
MKFLLTTFKVYYVLEGPQMGVLTEEEQMKRNQDETLCRGYILSTLTDRLYDQYTPMTSAMEYGILLKRNTSLKRKGQISLSLLNSLNFQGKITRKNNKGNDKKRKGTWNSSKDNKKDKKPLSEVVCYKCGEKGHIKCYCKNPKKKNQNSNKKDESANAVEQVDTTKITAMWYDSGETTHVYNNRDLFITYKETKDGHEVMIGDNHTSKVIGSGNVDIQFTSEKKLILMNVLHVPNIRKNLV